MNKMMLAVLALGLGYAGAAQAFLFGRNCGRGCGAAVAAPTCAPVQQQVAVPKCFKTIEVPAIERRIKQPDICETIPCPDKVVYHKQKPLVIPQPDICERIPQAPKQVWHKQPDIVTYECPVEASAAPARCGMGCR